MYYIKKIILDILCVSLLFLCATLIAGLIKALNPSMFTGQAANIAVTFWFAASIALQPAIWMKNVRKWKRFLAWLLALLGGVVIYLLMEFAAVYFLLHGNISFIFLGFAANMAFMLVSPILCSRLMIRFKMHSETELTKDKPDSVIRPPHNQTHDFQELSQTKSNGIEKYKKQKNWGKHGWMWILFGLLCIYLIGMLVVLKDIKSLAGIHSVFDWQKVVGIVSWIVILCIVAGLIYWVRSLFLNRYPDIKRKMGGVRDEISDMRDEIVDSQGKALESWDKINKESKLKAMQKKWATLLKGDTQARVAGLVGKPDSVENEGEDSSQEIWIFECGSGSKRSITFKDGFMVKIEVKF